jgi:hypothetical protein
MVCRFECAHLLIRPPVTLYAHSSHRQERSKRLTDLVIETGRTDLLNVDGICALNNLDLLARDLAENSNGETRTRKRVPTDEVSGNFQQSTELANLVCVFFPDGNEYKRVTLFRARANSTHP